MGESGKTKKEKKVRKCLFMWIYGDTDIGRPGSN